MSHPIWSVHAGKIHNCPGWNRGKSGSYDRLQLLQSDLLEDAVIIDQHLVGQRGGIFEDLFADRRRFEDCLANMLSHARPADGIPIFVLVSWRKVSAHS